MAGVGARGGWFHGSRGWRRCCGWVSPQPRSGGGACHPPASILNPRPILSVSPRYLRLRVHSPARTCPARGGDGPVTASPARNLRVETRFSRQIQPNPDKSRHFQPPHSQRAARPLRQRPITNGRKRVPVLQTGNVLRWHTQACARGLAPAWAITWRAFSPQDVTDGHRTVPIGVHRRLKTVPFCVIRGLNWPLAIKHFKSGAA